MDTRPEMTFSAQPVLGSGRREWNIVNGLGGRIDRFKGTQKQAETRAKELEALKRAGKPYLPDQLGDDHGTI